MQSVNIQLDSLQKRIPIIGDKALLDLVNGIQINKNIIKYRKSRGCIGQFIDWIVRNNYQHKTLLDDNFLAGQEALHEWILGITNSLQVSQVGLQITQQSLLETRQAIRQIKQDFKTQAIEFEEIIQKLSQELDRKFQALEQNIHRVEIRVAANEDLERIFNAWKAGQTYNKLPWTIQIVLIIKEFFSSAILTYELETGDTTKYRDILINKILSSYTDLPQNFFVLADLLEQTRIEITPQDCILVQELLEVNSISFRRLVATPTLFTLGKTLELARLPEDIRPNHIGKCAVALCRDQIDPISRTSDIKEFITTIVEETANDHLSILSERQLS